MIHTHTHTHKKRFRLIYLFVIVIYCFFFYVCIKLKHEIYSKMKIIEITYWVSKYDKKIHTSHSRQHVNIRRILCLFFFLLVSFLFAALIVRAYGRFRSHKDRVKLKRKKQLTIFSLTIFQLINSNVSNGMIFSITNTSFKCCHNNLFDLLFGFILLNSNNSLHAAHSLAESYRWISEKIVIHRRE